MEPNQLFQYTYRYDKRGLLISKTAIYTDPEVKHLADKAVERKELETGQPLDEAEKERIWNLIKKAAESS